MSRLSVISKKTPTMEIGWYLGGLFYSTTVPSYFWWRKYCIHWNITRILKQKRCYDSDQRVGQISQPWTGRNRQLEAWNFTNSHVPWIGLTNWVCILTWLRQSWLTHISWTTQQIPCFQWVGCMFSICWVIKTCWNHHLACDALDIKDSRACIDSLVWIFQDLVRAT